MEWRTAEAGCARQSLQSAASERRQDTEDTLVDAESLARQTSARLAHKEKRSAAGCGEAAGLDLDNTAERWTDAKC